MKVEQSPESKPSKPSKPKKPLAETVNKLAVRVAQFTEFLNLKKTIEGDDPLSKFPTGQGAAERIEGGQSDE